MKQQIQSQQQPQAAIKRPQPGSIQQPAPQTSRYPPREVPPRFMQQQQQQQQQQPLKSKQKGRVDGEFSIWGEAGGAWDKVPVDDNKDSWPSTEGQLDSTLEAGTGSAGTPNSNSGSVISSSSLSGVQGTTISVNASIGGSLHNAHRGAPSSNASPLQASQCSGSSMLGGCTLSQGDPQNSSNSQSAQSPPVSELGTISGHLNSSDNEPLDSSTVWGVASTVGDGPQGTSSPMNQNPIGAKSATSEPLGLQQATTSHNSHSSSVNERHLPPHQDMQSNVHASDSIERLERYIDSASGHTGGGLGRNFPECSANNNYRSVGSSSGGHSSSSQLSGGGISDSNGSHNQNISYGAPYNSDSRASSQVNGNDSNSCNSNQSFPGWQGLDTSSASSSSGKGWNIPDNGPTVRTSYASHYHSNSISSNGSHKVKGENNGNASLTCHSSNDNSEVQYNGLIGATGGSDYPQEESRNGNFHREVPSGWGVTPPRMGLLGGGESSLNNGTAGWGNPPPSGASSAGWGGNSRQSSNGATDMTSNPSTGMSPPKPQNTWAQAAGKGLNLSSSQNNSTNCSGNGGNNNGSQNDSGTHSGSSGTITKVRIEDHITELKIAAAYSEGWGQTTISQDTAWDVPLSPDANPKDNANSVWRAPANTGTEIWENNIRHHNKNNTTTVTSSNNQPWGHTPSTNIGGTWGEEEDTSNMWTGVPQSSSNTNSTWGEVNNNNNSSSSTTTNNNSNNNSSSNSNNNNMWGNVPSDNKHWGSQGSSWDGNGPDNGTSVWTPSANKNRSISNWSPVTTPKKDIQPSGWEEPSPPTNRRPLPNYDDGTAVWGNPMRQGKVSHWKDMPAAKPITNSVGVGNPSGGNMPPASVSGGPVMPPTGPGMLRLPTGATANNKPDMGTTVWGKPPPLNRGASWTDMPPHRDSPGLGGWEDTHTPTHMKSVPGTPSTPGSAFSGGWGEPTSPMTTYWGAKPKGSASNWADGQIDTSTWGGPSKQRGEMMQDGWPAAEEPITGNMWCDVSKNNFTWNGVSTDNLANGAASGGWSARKVKGGKPLTRDLIWASKQFRLLMEMGFKKEDIENSLRNNNMNFEDSLGELQTAVARESNMMEIDGYGGGRKIRPGSIADELGFQDHSLDPSFGQANFHGPTSFQGPQILAPGFAGAQGFKPQVKGSGLNSNTPSLLNNAALGGQASSLNIGNSISLSPAVVQKILQQQQQAQPFSPNNLPQNPLGGQAGRMSQQNFPSAAQLRHLVQQIQMAVQAGHLNPQILNQPLAPQTLQLLYQLLQQIKMLHQLQQQQIFQSQHIGKGGPTGPTNPSPLQLNVQITQTKQRIVNLQNQIAAQQALFLKQQQQLQHQPVQHPPLHQLQPPSADLFKPTLDTMPGLHTDLRELAIKDPSPHQSRLNQWKLPSFEKDDGSSVVNSGAGQNSGNNGAVTDFSRAPGSLSKPTNSPAISAASNLHPLLSQGESAWSSLPRPPGDSGGWPDTTTSSGANDVALNNNSNVTGTSSAVAATLSTTNGSSSCTIVSSENKESSPLPSSSGPSTTSTSHSSYNLSDLVPEFEPGKPWKGTSQMKSVEDDPHITPGSVARSPLSLNTIKDTELFNWASKTSPATTTSNDSLASSLASLTSSTWVFTPPTPAVHNSNASAGGKSVNNKSGWGPLGTDSVPGSEVWGTPVSKTRGPPPGLSGQGKGLGSSWGGGGAQTGRHSWGTGENRSGLTSGWERQNNSSFLLLRNLTPQIDGSTLKTLCMQHGPLQLFHLFLNHGIALVQYSTREEAAKAQSALNNCVLGNTTILADIPSDTEVQQYLQLAGGQLAGGSIGWPTPPQGNNSVTPGFRGGNASFPFGNTGGTANTGKLDSNAWNGAPLPGSQLWSYSSTGSSFWGASPSLNDHDHSTTSSLNSFLPGNLLGGESM